MRSVLKLNSVVDLCVYCIGCGSGRAYKASIPQQFDFVFDMPVVCDAFVMQHS